jgi:hypothetical protein
MALIPGTLPNDTCYGTPQDLLELFAQYLDVPAFALSSKVVFSTTNTGFTSDIVWFDTTSATRPIMKITVSSSGFLDYVKNYITAAPVVTIVGADSVLILDASDSGNTKRGLVSDITPGPGSITPAQLSQPFTSGTAVASTSGTAIDFTGIPSWVKRITVMLSDVSTNGASLLRMQLGVGGVATTTGYLGSSFASAGGGVANATFSSGVDFADTSADADRKHGNTVFTSVTGNTWSFTGMINLSNTGRCSYVAGSVPLGGTLNMVRVTTVNGTNAFDFGTINIMYEG